MEPKIPVDFNEWRAQDGGDSNGEWVVVLAYTVVGILLAGACGDGVVDAICWAIAWPIMVLYSIGALLGCLAGI